MKIKYTVEADVNECETINADYQDEYEEAVEEAVQERVKTMFDEGWHQAEFNTNVLIGFDGEPADGVLFTGWITLKSEIEND